MKDFVTATVRIPNLNRNERTSIAEELYEADSALVWHEGNIYGCSCTPEVFSSALRFAARLAHGPVEILELSFQNLDAEFGYVGEPVEVV